MENQLLRSAGRASQLLAFARLDALNPIGAVGFGDPERFSDADHRGSGGPFPLFERIEVVLLAVAIKQVNDIAVADGKAERFDAACSRHHRAADGKARWDGNRQTFLHDLAHETVRFVVRGWVKKDRAFARGEAFGGVGPFAQLY